MVILAPLLIADLMLQQRYKENVKRKNLEEEDFKQVNEVLFFYGLTGAVKMYSSEIEKFIIVVLTSLFYCDRLLL